MFLKKNVSDLCRNISLSGFDRLKGHAAGNNETSLTDL